jgi:hypothetical protein
MTYRLRHALPALALGLAACASAPVHYHTLLAPAAAAAPPARPVPFLLEVLPVGVPAQLDQPQFVVREGDGGVAVLDGERWASPLGDELRGALSATLAARLGTQDVAGLPAPAGRPVMRVKLQLRRLDAWSGQRVLLEADWSLGFADAPQARLACHGRFEQAAAGGYPALVAAEQHTVAALADAIAADARRRARSRDAGCAGDGAAP